MKILFKNILHVQLKRKHLPVRKTKPYIFPNMTSLNFGFKSLLCVFFFFNLSYFVK